MIRFAGIFVIVVAVVTWALFASSILDAVGSGSRAPVLGTVDATATATVTATVTTTAIAEPATLDASPTAGQSASPVTPTPAGEQRYTIEAGDNLSRIARRFGVTLQALLDANAISDPSRVRVGREIVIPAPGSE